MLVKCWGTRGSIPTPGPDTVRYGGNTTCLEVRTDEDELIILDAGSGIRPLGMSLLGQMPLDAPIFITHTHWDHIQGLPFFVPLFVPGNKLTLYSAPDPVTMKTTRDALSVQMEYRYFPVREAELKADIQYETLLEGQVIKTRTATVTPLIMNHPVLCYGYKIENNGKAVFFSGDHEPHYNIYKPEDDDFREYEKIIQEKSRAISAFLRGVDLAVMDSQYTEADYRTKVGWGHSTFDKCIALAAGAKVGRLLLTHHEPTRSDDALDAVYEDLAVRYKDSGLDFAIAVEGEAYEI